jgi:hypothetical protein
MRIASGGLGRHVKPEGLGSDPVLQWRIEHNHLSIHGDLQAPAPGLDRGLLNRQEVQFINLLSAPDQKLSCQAKQPGPPLGIQHVQRQRSFGERLARSRVNSDHAVLVVRHEDEWRPPDDCFLIDYDPNGHEWIPAQHRQGGPQRGNPLGSYSRPISLSQADDGGVNPETRVVQEDSPIQLAHIHVADDPIEHYLGRFLDIEGEAKILREVIQRAQGQDPQGNTVIEDRCGTGADRAISAACYQRLAAISHFTAHGGADLGSTGGQRNPGFPAG